MDIKVAFETKFYIVLVSAFIFHQNYLRVGVSYEKDSLRNALFANFGEILYESTCRIPIKESLYFKNLEYFGFLIKAMEKDIYLDL